MDFAKFIDDKYGYIRDAYNIIKDYGIAPGDYFSNLLGELIEKKTGNKDYTIDDLYNDKGIKLVIVGTDLSKQKSEYFYPNHKNENMRNIPIRKAVRISMSIPFLFEPIKMNGCLYVDGGVLDNFPLHVFDGDYPGDINARLNLCPPNPEVLGLNIMTTEEIGEFLHDEKEDINSFLQYSVSYVNIFLVENERRLMTPSYWHRTINIVTPDIPLTHFHLSEDEKHKLIDLGKKYTTEFFTAEINNR